MSRRITKIIVHCAATYPGQDVGAAEIRRWHLERGFEDIGYHGVIRRDGTLESGRPMDRAGAHTSGHNRDSIGICLVGGLQDGKGGDANADGRAERFENGQRGVPEANYTPAQWTALERLIRDLLKRYPGAAVRGHNEFAAKACPCFDVPAWWAGLRNGQDAAGASLANDAAGASLANDAAGTSSASGAPFVNGAAGASLQSANRGAAR